MIIEKIPSLPIVFDHLITVLVQIKIHLIFIILALFCVVLTVIQVPLMFYLLLGWERGWFDGVRAWYC